MHIYGIAGSWTECEKYSIEGQKKKEENLKVVTVCVCASRV